jgi:hypothetical protein
MLFFDGIVTYIQFVNPLVGDPENELEIDGGG